MILPPSIQGFRIGTKVTRHRRKWRDTTITHGLSPSSRIILKVEHTNTYKFIKDHKRMNVLRKPKEGKLMPFVTLGTRPWAWIEKTWSFITWPAIPASRWSIESNYGWFSMIFQHFFDVRQMFQMSPASPLPPLLAPLPAAPGQVDRNQDRNLSETMPQISTGWWCNVPILKNDGQLVNGKDDIPYILIYIYILWLFMGNKSHVWNHQPDP